MTHAQQMIQTNPSSENLRREVALMRRIVSLLSVVALIVAMLATSVAPAYADPLLFRCELGGEQQASTLATSQEIDFYQRNYNATCMRIDSVPGEAG